MMRVKGRLVGYEDATQAGKGEDVLNSVLRVMRITEARRHVGR